MDYLTKDFLPAIFNSSQSTPLRNDLTRERSSDPLSFGMRASSESTHLLSAHRSNHQSVLYNTSSEAEIETDLPYLVGAKDQFLL